MVPIFSLPIIEYQLVAYRDQRCRKLVQEDFQAIVPILGSSWFLVQKKFGTNFQWSFVNSKL